MRPRSGGSSRETQDSALEFTKGLKHNGLCEEEIGGEMGRGREPGMNPSIPGRERAAGCPQIARIRPQRWQGSTLVFECTEATHHLPEATQSRLLFLDGGEEGGEEARRR